jgi:hypothetical protein
VHEGKVDVVGGQSVRELFAWLHYSQQEMQMCVLPKWQCFTMSLPNINYSQGAISKKMWAYSFHNINCVYLLAFPRSYFFSHLFTLQTHSFLTSIIHNLFTIPYISLHNSLFIIIHIQTILINNFEKKISSHIFQTFITYTRHQQKIFSFRVWREYGSLS